MNIAFCEHIANLTGYVPVDPSIYIICLEDRNVYQYASGTWTIVGKYWG